MMLIIQNSKRKFKEYMHVIWHVLKVIPTDPLGKIR